MAAKKTQENAQAWIFGENDEFFWKKSPKEAQGEGKDKADGREKRCLDAVFSFSVV